MIEIIIPMKPVAKGRPRVTRRGITYTPKKTADAERVIAVSARFAMKAIDQHEPLEGPLVMKVEFILKPPGGWSKKKKEQALRGIILPTGRPDTKNYYALVEDALNGICYHDDSQIVRLEATKRYGETDSIHIQILNV